jgi:antitoxin component of MazEF toxin-antitoxin module
MNVRIVKSGSNRAVLIPAAIANELGWAPGDELAPRPRATGVLVTA